MGKTQKPTTRRSSGTIVSQGEIENAILLIRGHRVLLASELATMYGVSVKQLNQAVKRNAMRFPIDFVFQLTSRETDEVSRSQSVTLNKSTDARSSTARPPRGTNFKYRPYAFTEHGALMAANVLRSPRAIKVSVFIVRAFVKLREAFSAHRELAHKLGELEQKVSDHDQDIASLIHAVRELMSEPGKSTSKPRIGYETEAGK